MRPQVFIILASTFLVTSCGTEETEPAGEYVVVGRMPPPPDQKYFQAIEIHTKVATPVLSIRETTGRTYLPTMSSLPECDRKVVKGYISEDTVFVTTQVMRDTTVKTVGQ